MKNYVKSFTWVILILVVLTLGLVIVVQAGGSPRLRVAHAVADGTNADIYIDNKLLYRDIPYKNVSGYQVLASGEHNVKVLPSGVGAETPPVVQGKFPFANDQDYTMIAIGRIGGFELALFTDNNKAPEAVNVKILVIHVALNLPAIDVCLADRNECLVANLGFKNTSEYYVMAPGTYNFVVRQSGTNNVILSKSDSKFSSGVVYTLFIMGVGPTESGLKIVKSTDGGSPPDQPPINGAFLSPEALMVVVVAGLILLTGVGLVGWRLARRKRV